MGKGRRPRRKKGGTSLTEEKYKEGHPCGPRKEEEKSVGGWPTKTGACHPRWLCQPRGDKKKKKKKGGFNWKKKPLNSSSGDWNDQKARALVVTSWSGKSVAKLNRVALFKKGNRRRRLTTTREKSERLNPPFQDKVFGHRLP